jgi:hypothetical protein
MVVPLPETAFKIISETPHIVLDISKYLSLHGIFQFWKEPKIVGG